MSSAPPSPSPGPTAGSLVDTLQRWRLLSLVDKDLAAKKTKRALERLAGTQDPLPVTSAQVLALIASGKHGTARKTVRTALTHWQTQLQALLDQGDQTLLAELKSTSGPYPLHLLHSLPRHVPGTFLLDDVELHFPDGPSAASAHEEIYKKLMYDFRCDHPPRIIDGGANIGLAALFLKSRHPTARITCFEADPTVATYLKKNLAAAKLTDVEVIESALWDTDTTLEFSSEGSDAGRIGSSPAGTATRHVPAIRLSPYLNEAVDLLKLDIEGAELAVLREASAQLTNVQRLFVEYHSFEGQPQGLPELLAIIQAAGFRIALTVSDVLSPRPFLGLGSSLGMDMRVNVFGIRNP